MMEDRFNVWNEIGKALLSACIHSEDGMVADYCIEEGIGEKHFYSPILAKVWTAVSELRKENKAPDEMQLYMKLSEGGRITVEPATLTEIVNKVETYVAYKDFVARIKESYKCHELKRLAKTILDEVDVMGTASTQILGVINEAVTKLDETEKGLTPSEVFIEDAYDYLTKPEYAGKGLGTHLHSLNEVIKLEKKRFIVVAARPGLGKSSMGTNIADAVATRAKETVAIFSMEMTEQEVGVRLLCARSEKNPDRIREFSRSPVREVNDARDALKQAPIFVDDSGSQTVQRIAARCRRLKQSNGLGLVIIDYLQLIMAEKGSSRLTRQQQLGEVSRDLKRMAKDLDVPVLVLAQLSREHEKQGRKPKKTDLRESGDIEQDADIIVLIHQDDEMKESSQALAIVDKNRNGAEAEVPLIFQRFCTKFLDVEHNRAPSILDDDTIGCSVMPSKRN